MDTTGKETFKHREIRLEGLPASPGIAIGEVCIYKRERPVVRPVKIGEEEVEDNLARFKNARTATVDELQRILKRSDDEDSAEILAAQIEIVNDPELGNSIEKLIRKGHYKVDYAIYEAFRKFIDLIESSDNELFQERVIDIEDIRDRLIAVVRRHTAQPTIRSNTIVVTDELTPTETIQLAGQNMRALAMDSGGLTSHTSIIAHSMGITSVVGMKRITQLSTDGDQIIVDGNRGLVIVRPTDKTLEEYEKRLEEQEERSRYFRQIIDRPSKTKCGHPFHLRANVEFEEELENVTTYGASGIGLLRTESLYITRGHFEDGDNQEAFYESFIGTCDGEKVTIRLFDAGGDKFVEHSIREANPFLGWRGIRMMLSERELLREQLRSILKVAGRYPGSVQILVPMVSSIEEFIEVKDELRQVEANLRQQGVALDEDINLGIMVEVPSVAVQADLFAQHADFFSIGTNDLTQYTLAVDRGNELISHLYQQTHPAVWRLIRMTVKAALDNDIGIAVCGEIAANPGAAACLLGMGIDDLSMAPSSIPRVKEVLTGATLEEMKELSDQVEQAATFKDVDKLLTDWTRQRAKYD